MRASCEPVPGSLKGIKENPAVRAAGLNDDSDQADSYTGEEFVAAFRLIAQAREILQECRCWLEDHEKDPQQHYNSGQINNARKCISLARVVYRECYRSDIRRYFEETFGRQYVLFEYTLNRLEEIFGGA